MKHPWHRRPKEGVQAFEAFIIYRDMGSSRSLSQMGRDLNKSKTLFAGWSSKWGWIKRIEAYDQYIDEKRVEATVDEVEKRAKRHVALGHQMQGLGAKILKKFIEDEDAEITVADARLLITAGIEAERRASGDTDTVLDVKFLDTAVENLVSVLSQEIKDPKLRQRLRERFTEVIAGLEETRGNGAG